MNRKEKWVNPELTDVDCLATAVCRFEAYVALLRHSLERSIACFEVQHGSPVIGEILCKRAGSAISYG
jgi:hypothetical protein